MLGISGVSTASALAVVGNAAEGTASVKTGAALAAFYSSSLGIACVVIVAVTLVALLAWGLAMQRGSNGSPRAVKKENDQVGEPPLHSLPTGPPSTGTPPTPSRPHPQSNPVDPSSSEAQGPFASGGQLTAEEVLASRSQEAVHLYNTGQAADGWVVVPPKDLLDSGECTIAQRQPTHAVGPSPIAASSSGASPSAGTACMNFFRSIFGCSPSKIAQSQSPKQDAKPDAQEQMGGWKIFINIDQRYMMTAIPLLLQILHGPEAPRCMFKFSTSAGASQVCGIGKSVELIFSRDAEEEARRSPENCGVKKTLEAIGLAFYEALHNVIRPECGSLPQAGNVGCLVASKECKNLEKGRFVRKIPITHGVLRTCNLPYFTYRHEKWEGGPVLPPEEAEALRKRAENWRAEGLHCPRVDLREDPYKDIRLQWHDRFNR